MPPPGDPHHRFRRSMWAMVGYLAGFAVLCVVLLGPAILTTLRRAARRAVITAG